MKNFVCNFFLLLVLQYILVQLCFGQFSFLFKNLYLSTLPGWFHGCILTNRVIFWVASFFCFSAWSFCKMLMPTLGNVILWDWINNLSLLEVTREPKLHKWFWQLHNKVSTKVRVLMFAANHFAWGNGIDLELFRAVWIQSEHCSLRMKKYVLLRSLRFVLKKIVYLINVLRTAVIYFDQNILKYLSLILTCLIRKCTLHNAKQVL